MSESDLPVIPATETLLKSVPVSLLFGMPVLAIGYWVTYMLNFGPVGVVISLVLAILTAKKVWILGLVPPPAPGFVMVKTLLGEPIEEIHPRAELWKTPGVEDYLPVDAREHRVDPEIFMELAADKIPVLVDGYFLAQTVNPVRFFKVHGSDEILDKSFRGATRAFIASWLKAAYMTDQRDLLAKYLMLSPNHDPLHPPHDHVEFELDLREYTVPDPSGAVYLSDTGITSIMCNAGNFKKEAERFGVRIPNVTIEEISLPKEIIEAASKVMEATSDMEVVAIRQAMRMKIVEQLMGDDPSMKRKDAIDRADRMLPSVGVKTEIRDMNITGGEWVANSITQLIAMFSDKRSTKESVDS